MTDGFGDSRADLISKPKFESFACDARYEQWLTTHSATLQCRLDQQPPTSDPPFAANAKVLMFGNSHILQTSNALVKMYEGHLAEIFGGKGNNYGDDAECRCLDGSVDKETCLRWGKSAPGMFFTARGQCARR